MKFQYISIVSCLYLVLSMPFPDQLNLVKRQWLAPDVTIEPQHVDSNGLLLPDDKLAELGVSSRDIERMKVKESIDRSDLWSGSFVRPDGTYMDEEGVRRVMQYAGQPPEEASQISQQIASGTFNPNQVRATSQDNVQWTTTPPPSDVPAQAPPSAGEELSQALPSTEPILPSPSKFKPEHVDGNGLLLSDDKLAQQGLSSKQIQQMRLQEWADNASLDMESFRRPDGTYMDAEGVRRVVELAGKTPEEADNIAKEIAAGTYDPNKVEYNPNYYSPTGPQQAQAEPAPLSDAPVPAPQSGDASIQAPPSAGVEPSKAIPSTEPIQPSPSKFKPEHVDANGLLLSDDKLAQQGLSSKQIQQMRLQEWADNASIDMESFRRPDGTYMDAEGVRRVVELAGKTPEEADNIAKEIAAGTYDPIKVDYNPNYYSPSAPQQEQTETAPTSNASAPPSGDALAQVPSPPVGTGSSESKAQEGNVPQYQGESGTENPTPPAVALPGAAQADQAKVLGADEVAKPNTQPSVKPAVSNGLPQPDFRKDPSSQSLPPKVATTGSLPPVTSVDAGPPAKQIAARALSNPAQPAAPASPKPAPPSVPKPAIPAVPKPAPKPKPSASKSTSSGEK
ncbi:hypothetical protein MP228_012715 [Amoeboaphelidium protococcarum]|nr:hypothetical protein MP228_012715 [Amoeboaphelidium protococcarum]